jgi:hypothetical protein
MSDTTTYAYKLLQRNKQKKDENMVIELVKHKLDEMLKNEDLEVLTNDHGISVIFIEISGAKPLKLTDSLAKRLMKHPFGFIDVKYSIIRGNHSIELYLKDSQS